MSRRRKKPSHQPSAVPEEILADGSGPHDASALADAAAEILAKAAIAEIEADAMAANAIAAEHLGDAPTARDPAEASRLQTDDVASGRDAELDAMQTEADDIAGDASLEDAAIRADAEAEDAVIRADAEAELEDAVIRAEAEAELGAAEEPETADGEGDIGAALPTTAASMDDRQLKHLIEALVFAADKPVTLPRLRQLTRVSDVRRLERVLDELAVDYADRGLALQQVSGGYQFRTNTQFSVWVQQLIAGRPVRLSRAQLETLAIIAYRQPITRPEVDEIRGVDSSATLRLLMDRALIRILGRKEDVGRPILYGTTREFLDFFSLGDLRELPTLREYSELTAESRKVMIDELGVGLDARVAAGDEAGLDIDPPADASISAASMAADDSDVGLAGSADADTPAMTLPLEDAPAEASDEPISD